MIVETKLWHYISLLDRLRAKDVAAIEAFTAEGASEEWAINSYRGSTFSWTFLDTSGLPYAIWALYEVVPGVLNTWAVGTEEGGRRAREWFAFINKTINSILEHTQNHRIECYVLEGFDGAERTIKKLGFDREGVRFAAGKNRENAILYAKVKP